MIYDDVAGNKEERQQACLYINQEDMHKLQGEREQIYLFSHLLLDNLRYTMEYSGDVLLVHEKKRQILLH
jgi:hypothetical protein